jgi:hypothetical protein
MAVKRQFQIVLVRPQHGTGPEPVSRVDKSVDYDGTTTTVQLAE